jgi:Protein of unknown function (DUF3500)
VTAPWIWFVPALESPKQTQLVELIELYISRTRDGRARVKMDEVARHIARTHFVWLGGIEDDSVFYYRIHSPVMLIEFDHLNGVAFDNDEPTRNHINTVLRTPTGTTTAGISCASTTSDIIATDPQLRGRRRRNADAGTN